MRHGFASTVAVSTLLLAGAASAQPLGTSGQVALGADRLFGYSHFATTTEDDAGNESTMTYGSIGLLGSAPFQYSDMPRLSVDYFAIDGLSIGGSVMYLNLSLELEMEGLDSEPRSQNMFVIGPRVGYAVMFNDNVGIWPRGGLTYGTTWYEDEYTDPITGETVTTDVSMSQTAINLEGMLVLSPANHVAITLGPTVDIGVAGTAKTEGGGRSAENDVTTFGFGVQAGLLAWF